MTTTITQSQLKLIYPQATEKNITRFFNPIKFAMSDAGILETNNRAAMFLAQIGHESGQLRYMEEIASGKAYEGRKDLGNVEEGDGVRFKGRGLIQITGRHNYQAFADFMGMSLELVEAYLRTPTGAAYSAAWYWGSRNLNKWADENDFDKVTRLINGGLNGYNDRLRLYSNALIILAGGPK